MRSIRAGRPRRPTEFLDRAEADAVGLAEGAVDGARFCDPHLRAVDRGRYVGGVGVAVSDEAARARTLIHGRLKDPSGDARIAESFLKDCTDSKTSPPRGYLKQPGVSHIPLLVEEKQITAGDRKTEFFSKITECHDGLSTQSADPLPGKSAVL